jgi:AraC family transcriptional regulator
MQASAPVGPASLCRPFTASHFAVEHSASINGIHVEIRRFGWNYSCDATFQANSHYLDYSLMPRSARSRLFYTDRPHTPPPGQIVFIPEGSVFAAHNDPCEQRLLCLTFEHERALGLFENDARALDLLPCFDVRAPRVRQTMARLAEEVREPGFGHDILLESLALTIIVELRRHLRERSGPDPTRRCRLAPWRLKRLRERIEAGFDLTIPELAAECGMSPRHLIRTFKNTVGMTLSDYIAAARIERAKDYLRQRDVFIKVIAYNCGFQSAAAFSAAFRQATGMTPKAFREECRDIAGQRPHGLAVPR